MREPEMSKPFSESSFQNQDVIFSKIEPYLLKAQSLLEVGSGTGQHAVNFTSRVPGLIWQTSDLVQSLPGINAWIDETGYSNCLRPIAFDVDDVWPTMRYDLIYTANTLHIMSLQTVDNFLSGLPTLLNEGGCFLVYGPFNYNNRYTSASNQDFDQWLKSNNPASGIKDFEWIVEACNQGNINLKEDIEMPANNRILAFRREL